MSGRIRATALAVCMLVNACGGGGGGDGSAPAQPVAPVAPPSTVNGPAWWNFGRDSQHAAQSGIATQSLSRIVWQTAVDLVPPYRANNVLPAHYGSPIISARNTVLLPVKLNLDSGFRVEARAGANGALLWSAATDYVLPAHDWTPSYNIALTQGNRLYFPGAGGKLHFRDDVDSAAGTVGTLVFYGSDAYNLAPTTYDAAVLINTPLTIDAHGNVYFGFIVIGATPIGLQSGIARVAADGTANWVSAAAASNNPLLVKVAMNSAPALSADLSTLYVVVTNAPPAGQRPWGSLLALDAQTLATRGQIELLDSATGARAWISDNASSSPSVAPDGDVYFGVLESNAPAHNFRGWMLHFDSTLTVTKVPGSFGWDQTVSFAPRAMVPQYTGTSSYLVVSKYNNYFGVGTGNGRNQMAILDPADNQIDSISAIPVMREVLTIVGPTPEFGQPGTVGAVREWCVNTTSVDPATSSILVNSADGRLYRWHLPSNQLTQNVRFNNGYVESYTPTAIGPDGKVYAINNATLFAVGQ